MEVKTSSMIPNTKISHIILEYGKSVILQLPSDHTKQEFEAVIKMVITAWNAVVLDGWEQSNRFEMELLSSIKDAPREVQQEVRRLINRKKKHFGSDPRGVGNYWVRERDGEMIFGCEARLSVRNAPAKKTKH